MATIKFKLIIKNIGICSIAVSFAVVPKLKKEKQPFPFPKPQNSDFDSRKKKSMACYLKVEKSAFGADEIRV